MSPISKAVALPAATAGLLYLTAKHFIPYDAALLWQALRVAVDQKRRDRSGRHNLFYVLEEHALNPKLSDHACLIFEEREWTFRQAYDMVLSYAAWLKSEHNVQKDEVIALDCMNRPNFVFLWFAIWSLGASVAMINYNLTDKSLLHSVQVSTARLILVDEDVRSCFPANLVDELENPSLGNGKRPTKVAFFSDQLEEDVRLVQGFRDFDSARSLPDGTSMSMLIYTSGTTGLPKPATIHWNKIHGICTFVAGFLELKQSDRFFTCMPLYHSAGALLATTVSIHAGCTLVLGHKFSTKTFWKSVRAAQATVIQYVGETCRYLLSAEPDSLDKVNNVRMAFGNGLRPDIWDAFKERFDIPEIAEFYGATEGAAGLWNRSRNSLSAGAVGRSGKLLKLLFGGRSILVQHDHATETPYRDPVTGLCNRIDTTKPESPPGEFISRLPEDPQELAEMFPGYYNNPTATDSKIIRNVLVKGDAYYRSGDMLRIDPEGRVYFHDRIGDTFRWKSENVSTNEVSEALGRHPAVAEANVYGVEVPGHDGRAGCVAMVLKSGNVSVRDGAGNISSDTLSGLAQQASDALPRYARPVFLRLTSKMETTGTNKQSKVALRNEGIDPSQVEAKGDKMFWLQGGTWKPYGNHEWEQLKAGKVKL